ncbi:recombinase family protein [Arthrobacter sp. TMT4-20]
MTTSAIYLRISADKGKATGETGLAVDRQDAEIRKMLDRKGWKAGKVYTDNDLTASGAKRRPAYEQMISDFRTGEIQAISAWDLDRLWRVPTEFEALLQLVTDQGLMLATVGGDADLSTDNGILYARIKVAVAADELRKRAARQRAKFAQDREQGKNHWRGRRPFGLELDGSLNEREAEALQTVAGMILEGATLNKCVRWLNDEGVTTTFGGPWSRSPLKRTIMLPRLIGKMERNPLSKADIAKIKEENEKLKKEGKPIPPTPEPELVEGNWEPILEDSTWIAVRGILTNPAGLRKSQTKHTEKDYLLSGVATCAKCGKKAYGTMLKRAKGNRVTAYAYRCADIAGHFSKTMDRTDKYVYESTMAMLMLPGAQGAYASVQTVNDLQSLREARAAELTYWEDWRKEAARERFPTDDYRLPREAHEGRLARINGELLSIERLEVIGIDDTGALLENWDSISLERKRSILRTVWKDIQIRSTGRGVRFSEDHIKLIPSAQTQAALDRATTPVTEPVRREDLNFRERVS